MEKVKEFIKNLRVEYKVAIFFLILVLLYIPYSIIKKNLFDENHITLNTNIETSASAESSDSQQSPSSISDAVNAERPIILSESGLSPEFQDMMNKFPEIKHIETATQVSNPTIWVYVNNDGLRKDDLAENYCNNLHSLGIMASSVTIYDERARRSGKLVELGEHKCM